MKSRLPASLAALLSAAAAFATPPAAPQVTVGASHIKQLRFDWQIVPRSNYYELWFKANDGAPEVKFGEAKPWRPSMTNNISAHLLDWNQARYRVTACNPSGCGSSPALSVKNVLPDTVGFVKSTFPLDEARFGSTVKVSEDGSTLVAVANEANDADFEFDFTRLYVFKRLEGEWRLDSVVSPNQQTFEGSGLSLAVSADGNRMAVGMPEVRTSSDPGVAMIFRRTSSGWIVEQRITADLERQGSFAAVLDMDAAGDTLISSRDATLEVWRRVGTTWTLASSILTPSCCCSACYHAALSQDGNTIAVTTGSSIEVYSAPAWTLRNQIQGLTGGAVILDFTGNTLAVQTSAPVAGGQVVRSVAVFHRSSGEYALEANLPPSAWAYAPLGSNTSRFGAALALSRDGEFLAVGDSTDNTTGEGVLSPPLRGPSPEVHGAVYVFQRHGTTWRLRRLVKPDHEPGVFGPNAYEGFGSALSLGDNGRTLIIGQQNESTFIPNSGNHEPSASGVNSGALWMY